MKWTIRLNSKVQWNMMKLKTYLDSLSALGHVLQETLEQIGYPNIRTGYDSHLELNVL